MAYLIIGTLVLVVLLTGLAIWNKIQSSRETGRGTVDIQDNMHLFDKLEEIRKLLQENNELLKSKK